MIPESITQRSLDGIVDDPEMGFLDGTIPDAAYQISRGIRPLALVCTVAPDPIKMLRAYNRLTYLGSQLGGAIQPIPVVVLRPDGSCADAGYAAMAWAAETFQWLIGNVPQPHLDRLLGLLLGYSPQAHALPV